MALALLCAVCSNFTAPHELPHHAWELLGTNIVVTPQALDLLATTNKPYRVIDNTRVIDQEITGAIVAGVDIFLEIQIVWLTLQRGWLSDAPVIVLAETVEEHVFSCLWSRNKLSNVVFYTRTGLYIYNPFLKSIIPVGEHVRKNLTDRWKDLNGSKVSVSVYENPTSYIAKLGTSLGSGLDGSALYELSKYWNMTVKIRVNHNMNDSESQVIQGTSDLSMMGRPLFYNSHELRLSTIVYGDKVCLIIKIPEKLRGWDVLWRIYDRKVYVMLIFTIYITNKAYRLLAKDKGRKDTLRMVIRTMNNIGIQRPPVAFRERIILSSTMIFGLIYVTIFQASMFHFVRFDVRYPRMQTLLDVFRTNIPLRSNEIGLKDFFVPWDMKEIRKLGKKIQEDENIQSALKYAGLVIREEYYNLLRDANLLPKDVYVLNQRVGSFTMAYSVKRGSPYLEPLTHFTSRVFEAGLYIKWRNMTVAKIARYNDMDETTSAKRCLHMSDTEVAFVVLFIGHGLAFVVFLFELYVKHRSRIRLHKVWRFLKDVSNKVFQ